MIRSLALMGRHAPLTLAFGVVLGIFLPGLGSLLVPTLPPLVVMLLAVAMIRVDFAQVLVHLRRPLRLTGLLLLLMVVTPLAVHHVALWFELPLALHLALVLMACAPPLASSPGLAILLGLDDALALNVMVAGTLIVPFIAPPLIVSVLELPIDLDAGALFLRLGVTIGLALMVAAAARWKIGRQRLEAHGDALNGASALIMVIFAVAVMNGVGLALTEGSWQWTHSQSLLSALAGNWGLQAVAVVGIVLTGRVMMSGPVGMSRSGGAVALMAGNRNMALFIAALPLETAAPILLFLAFYQIPIYLTPFLVGPFYRRIVNR